MKTYKGSCHCGEVQFEFEGDVTSAIECNCSMCSRKGTILTFVQDTSFKILAGAQSLSKYQFYKKVLDHTFCKNCGVTPFVTGKNPKGELIKAVNARCLENFDLKSLQITQVDGKSF